MESIRILDKVEQASSYEDGQVIFDLIAPLILRGEAVEVSFDGLHAVPSAFINAAFVQLVERSSVDQVQRHLMIKDSTKFINGLIRDRFNFVAAREAERGKLPPVPTPTSF